eukprot:scaffold12403_cov33-Phaeocystis_antarctica.AAC.1
MSPATAAASPAAAAAAAGTGRSAPEILFGGLGNLGVSNPNPNPDPNPNPNPIQATWATPPSA